MSKIKKLSILLALFIIFCSGFYYLLAAEYLWLENSNYSVRYGGDDTFSSQVYQSINGRFYVYLIEKNNLQAIFLIDKTKDKVGYANDYLNRFSLFGFTINSHPISYDISAEDIKTGFDPKLEIQPNIIRFYIKPEDVLAKKAVVIQFYDN